MKILRNKKAIKCQKFSKGLSILKISEHAQKPLNKPSYARIMPPAYDWRFLTNQGFFKLFFPKGKKAMTWEEIAKWIIIGVLLIILIISIIGPARRAMFEKISELFASLKFGM